MEGVYRVEPRRAHGGVEAEGQADSGAEGEPPEHPLERYGR